MNARLTERRKAAWHKAFTAKMAKTAFFMRNYPEFQKFVIPCFVISGFYA
jgi:hypothetical protein